MSQKEVFLYTIKANGFSPLDILYSNSKNGNFSWIDLYSSNTDFSNYNGVINDEFKKDPYFKKKYNELINGQSSIDMNKTFEISSYVNVGKYNMNEKSFPLSSIEFFNNIEFLTKLKTPSYFHFEIKNIYNFAYFDFALKINPQKAENFINSRKDQNEKINRLIRVNIVYNVLDKKSPISNIGGSYKAFLNVYVHRIEFYDGLTLLGKITPVEDFFDKVKFVKLLNGSDTIYYNNKWDILRKNQKSTAEYYRITNYKDGIIAGKVIDYFINGKIQMEGSFIDGDIMDGQFIWYFENGRKYQEATYSIGKLNGMFYRWFSNGQIENQVKYVNNLKEGCDYHWHEDGSCNSSTWGDPYAPFYIKGVSDSNSKECKCTN